MLCGARRVWVVLVCFEMPTLEVLDFAIAFLSGLAVSLLDLAEQLVTLAGDDIDIIVRQLPPLFANLSLELYPIAFDRLLIHDLPPRLLVWSDHRR
jgi:hypothetical protein